MEGQIHVYLLYIVPSIFFRRVDLVGGFCNLVLIKSNRKNINVIEKLQTKVRVSILI